MTLRRRKLLYTGLTTLLILLAANGAAGLLRVKYWRPDYQKWKFNLYVYQRARSHSDILFLGSSITRFDVVSQALEGRLKDAATEASVFNLGNAASTSLQSAIVLRDMIGSNGCPEMIVHEVSAGGLNAGIDQTDFISDFASFRDLPLLAPDLLSITGADAFLTSRMGGLVALYYHVTHPSSAQAREVILRRTGSRWHPQGRKKGKTVDRGYVDRRSRMVQRFRLRHSLREYEVGGASVRGLETVVRLASDCGSSLLLLRFPTILPVDTQELRLIEGEFEEYIRDFSRRSGARLYEIDPGDASLTLEHYHDLLHLNRTGAMRFTAFLADEIIGPQLRAARAPRS